MAKKLSKKEVSAVENHLEIAIDNLDRAQIINGLDYIGFAQEQILIALRLLNGKNNINTDEGS